jgi:hypothetical protein
LNCELSKLLSPLILLPFLFSAIWLFFMVHVFTEKAEAQVRNSSFVKANKSLYDSAGLIGKSMRNGLLTLALLTPNIAVTRGLLAVDDVKSFPAGLKRVLFITWGASFFLTGALGVLHFFRKVCE